MWTVTTCKLCMYAEGWQVFLFWRHKNNQKGLLVPSTPYLDCSPWKEFVKKTCTSSIDLYNSLMKLLFHSITWTFRSFFVTYFKEMKLIREITCPVFHYTIPNLNTGRHNWRYYYSSNNEKYIHTRADSWRTQ